MRTKGKRSEVTARSRQQPRSPSMPANRSKPEICVSPSGETVCYLDTSKREGLAQVVNAEVVDVAHPSTDSRSESLSTVVVQ